MGKEKQSISGQPKTNKDSRPNPFCKLEHTKLINGYNPTLFRKDMIGENMKISDDRLVAERTESYSKGHVVLDELLEVHRYIKIEVQKIQKFYGGLVVGLTSLDESLIEGQIINNDFEKPIAETYVFQNVGCDLEPGGTIVICLLCTGELQMRINDNMPEVLCTLDSSKKYRFFADVCNGIKEIKAFVNDQLITEKCRVIPPVLTLGAEQVRFRRDFDGSRVKISEDGFQAFSIYDIGGPVIIEKSLKVYDIMDIRIEEVDDSYRSSYLQMGLTTLDLTSIMYRKWNNASDTFIFGTHELSPKRVKNGNSVLIKLLESGVVHMRWNRGKSYDVYSEEILDTSKSYTVFCNISKGIKRITAYMVDGQKERTGVSNIKDKGPQEGNSRSYGTRTSNQNIGIVRSQMGDAVVYYNPNVKPGRVERQTLSSYSASRLENQEVVEATSLNSPANQNAGVETTIEKQDDKQNLNSLGTLQKKNSLVNSVNPNRIIPEGTKPEDINLNFGHACSSFQNTKDGNQVSASQSEIKENPRPSTNGEFNDEDRVDVIDDAENLAPQSSPQTPNENLDPKCNKSDGINNPDHQTDNLPSPSPSEEKITDDKKGQTSNPNEKDNEEVISDSKVEETEDKESQNEVNELKELEKSQATEGPKTLQNEVLEDKLKAKASEDEKSLEEKEEQRLEEEKKTDEKHSELECGKNKEKLNPPVPSKACVVCLEKEMNTVLYKCGHKCMCYDCAYDWYIKGNGRCPLCRMIIQDVIKIFEA